MCCAKYRTNNRAIRGVCIYPYEELIMLMVKRTAAITTAMATILVAFRYNNRTLNIQRA